MSEQRPPRVAVARGDGIGPEITDAALKVLEAAGAKLEIQEVELGLALYARGLTAGIDDAAWQTITDCGVLFKAPITTPQGGGMKSLNVTLRKSLGLYANVRPCRAYAPFVPTRHPEMDVVIVRENEEDLYAGIEHRQTHEVYQCLKLISRPGSERIVRFAFEYARAHGRSRVTCCTKDNIMKLTDGLFHRVFDEVAADYPEIDAEHWIIDIGAAKLADAPHRFDVVVVPNLYGDILSDIVAEISGSVGLGASANIGSEVAMFEAIHGSAPDIAGEGIANPSGLLLAGAMMLEHLGQPEVAARIQNAWLCAIERGQHTVDIANERYSPIALGTREFAQAVIEQLGSEPRELSPIAAAERTRVPTMAAVPEPEAPADKQLVGVDVFIDNHERRDVEGLAARLAAEGSGQLTLTLITNRGVQVWPRRMPQTFCTDHWRCRFCDPDLQPLEPRAVVDLMGRLVDAGLDVIKSENLYTFDGEIGFSLGQGQ